MRNTNAMITMVAMVIAMAAMDVGAWDYQWKRAKIMSNAISIDTSIKDKVPTSVISHVPGNFVAYVSGGTIGVEYRVYEDGFAVKAYPASPRITEIVSSAYFTLYGSVAARLDLSRIPGDSLHYSSLFWRVFSKQETAPNVYGIEVKTINQNFYVVDTNRILSTDVNFDFQVRSNVGGHSLACGPTRMIVIGKDQSLASSDGITWTVDNNIPHGDSLNVDWCNDRFIIPNVATSTDGITWTTIQNTGLYLRETIGTPDRRYLSVGIDGKAVSDDGVNWEVYPVANDSIKYSAVASSRDSLMVIVGPSTIYYGWDDQLLMWRNMSYYNVWWTRAVMPPSSAKNPTVKPHSLRSAIVNRMFTVDGRMVTKPKSLSIVNGRLYR